MKRIPRIKMPVSPIGTASFPKLTKPDFKYKAIEGEFSVRLILTPEEVADYKQTYDENLKELYKWQCEQEGKQKTEPFFKSRTAAPAKTAKTQGEPRHSTMNGPD